jgi:2',3'-cyclic-nucleotide 2'-phosphodiesterase (5'-nucleotidase family)
MIDFSADMSLVGTDNVETYDVYINDDYYGSDVSVIQITTNDILRIEVTKIDNTQHIPTPKAIPTPRKIRDDATEEEIEQVQREYERQLEEEQQEKNREIRERQKSNQDAEMKKQQIWKTMFE